MVKLKDIAQKLNISVSTVSRVVNNKDRVDPKTRELVLDALKNEHYLPNELARSLKRKHSNTIGVIVPDISNPFFATVIKGIESEARKRGYMVILCNSDEDPETEKEYVQLLLQIHVTAVILATVGGSEIYIEQVRNQDVPVIFFDNVPKLNEKFDFITTDNVKASYDLTKYLLEMGHRKIAVITGPLKETTASDRLLGYKQALREYGVRVNKDLIKIGNFKQDSGYQIMNEFLNAEDIPTAIFAANNYIAYGALKAIREKGLIVPDDMSIVSFDVENSEIAEHIITSIVQPAIDIGRIASQIVFEKVGNPGVKAFRSVVLDPTFIIGESCKPVN